MFQCDFMCIAKVSNEIEPFQKLIRYLVSLFYEMSV